MTAYTKFHEIKTAYLSSLQTISKSTATYDKYSTVINDFAKWLEQNDGEQPDITSVMILAYSKVVKERGACNNTLRHYLIILRSFFTWCVNHKFYTEQPVLGEDIPKEERIEYDLLSEEQIESVLEGTIPKFAHKGIRNRALVIMFIQSGLRVSELTHLRIGDLDFEGQTIRTVGKGDKLRYTTFPPLCSKYINEYLNERYGGKSRPETDYLFPSFDKEGNQKPYTRQNITKVVRGYIRNLVGKDHIGSHDLRHSFASMLITKDASLTSMSEVLGHSDWKTTAIYASHLCPKRVSQDLNGLLG